MTKQTILTEADIAALASGATAAKTVVEPTEAELAAARAEAEALEAVRVAAEAETARLAAEAAVKPVEKAESELVAFLNAQVKEKDAAILAMTIEVRDLKAKAEGVDATHSALTDLVRASVGKMQVALGGHAVDMASLTDVQVLAEHKRVAADFLAKFKVGGVAISAPEVKPEGEVVAATALQAAKLAAVKQATK